MAAPMKLILQSQIFKKHLVCQARRTFHQSCSVKTQAESERSKNTHFGFETVSEKEKESKGC